MIKKLLIGLILLGTPSQAAYGIAVKCKSGSQGTLTQDKALTCGNQHHSNVTGCCLVEVWKTPDQHTLATFIPAPPPPVHHHGPGPAPAPHPMMQSQCYVYSQDTIPNWCVQARHARPLHNYIN